MKELANLGGGSTLFKSRSFSGLFDPKSIIELKLIHELSVKQPVLLYLEHFVLRHYIKDNGPPLII